MAKTPAKKAGDSLTQFTASPAVEFARKAIGWWLPLLYLLISSSFYLRTYDSAQVKITLVQMGGLSLLVMWVCLLVLEGRKAFTKSDFVFLAPFLFYAAYIVFSFLHVPYKGPSIDDFIRYLFYMSVAIIVIVEFDDTAMSRLNKILVLTGGIAVGYGILQVLDTRLTPAAQGAVQQMMHLDPFVWRAAFGPRIFSTYGNPNFFADFTVLMFFILIAQYLKTKSFYLLPLVLMDVACLYFTETKGAWIGFSVGLLIFVIIYGIFFLREYYYRHRWQINSAAIAVLVLCLSVVGIFAAKRKQSVNFRIFTWLSTWEMIETQPLTGTGVGCFKVIYPAFRRPQIFHIEQRHNTETDHAENEHLEQWLDNGIIGFGIYIWLIMFTVIIGLRALGEHTAVLAKAGPRAPPKAYDLLGYLTAFTGMLSHNFFDVSMRFVSSGVYLGLLSGIVVNLARGSALYEVHAIEHAAAAPPPGKDEDSRPDWLANILRIISAAVLVFFAGVLFKQFAHLQGIMDQNMSSGEALLWTIAWGVFGCVVLGVLFVFLRILWLSGKSKAVPLILVLMLGPMYYLWGFFKADVFHNLAIFFSKNQDWNNAVYYYKQSNQLNPYSIMPYYFTGNVFKDRFDMEPKYNPDWGDADRVPKTDFDRSMAFYEKVRALAPNYVQTHFQAGELYIKMGNYYKNKGDAAKSNEYYDKALYRLGLYHNLDPVFPYTYYHRANIYMMRGQYDKAEKEYEDNLYAPYCHEKGHLHESIEVYNYLTNVKIRLGKYKEALALLERAMTLYPENAAIKQNYAAIRARLGGAAVTMEALPPQNKPAK